MSCIRLAYHTYIKNFLSRNNNVYTMSDWEASCSSYCKCILKLEVYFKMADDFCASGHAQWVRSRINTSNSYTLCWVAPTKYYLAACWYRSLQNFLKCVKTKVVKFECGCVVRSQMRANVVIRELILQECNIMLPCIQLSCSLAMQCMHDIRLVLLPIGHWRLTKIYVCYIK